MKQSGFKLKPCACGGMHTPLMCPNKPRVPLRKEAIATRSKRTFTSREWFEKNPPDEKGVWICYLQLMPDCPIKLTRSTIRLEHVKSKTRYPELKYDINNLRPACSSCNRYKGSRDLDELTNYKD